jgi:hypothetical protein
VGFRCLHSSREYFQDACVWDATPRNVVALYPRVEGNFRCSCIHSKGNIQKYVPDFTVTHRTTVI